MKVYKTFFLNFFLLLTPSLLFSLTLNGNKVEFYDFIKLNNLDSSYETVLVKFKKPLKKEEKNKYIKMGVKTIKYAGDLAYYFLAKRELFKKLSFEKGTKFAPFLPIYKISQRILKKETNDYAIDENGKYILNVITFYETDLKEIENLLKDIESVEIIKHNENETQIKISYEEIEKLSKIPQIWRIEEKKPPISFNSPFYLKKRELKNKREDTLENTTNLAAYRLMGVSKMWEPPYNLTGEGVKIALVDWGKVRKTHQEFQEGGESRVIIEGEQDRDLSFHATHIAGTIAAKGVNEDSKGGAPKSTIYDYYAPEISYTRAVLKAFFDKGITLSHHAYLYQDPAYSGVYDEEASSLDKAVRMNPTLNVFMAGGNDRTNPEYPNWGMMRGPTNAKNVFTFGLSVDDGKIIKYYSNTGPVNDGRIKPDLTAAAPGNGRLLSTSIESDTAYKDGGGTSSATARAMGAAALLLEEYKRLTGKEGIREDILKALLINTAKDGGREGPDYEFGFGNIAPFEALLVLKTLSLDEPLLKTGTVTQDEIQKFYIQNDKTQDIKVTINWIDPEGDVNNQDKTLVNDIDIWIEKDGKVYYPFSLDKNNPQNLATANGFNRIDNTEQIVIKNASPGIYKLFVKGYQIITDSQDYAIASSIYLNDKNPSKEENEESDTDNDNNATDELSVPLPPSNLKATAIDEHRIKLSWIDNSDNEMGFKIFRDGKLIHVTNPNIESFTDTGLKEDTLYTYTIKAYNEKGDSPFIQTEAKTEKSSPAPVYTTETKILEDAQENNTDKWGIYDHIPWGYGKIENVYDPEKKSRVIKLSDSRFINHTTNEENGIGFKLNELFNETKFKNISFEIKTKSYFTIFLAVKTVSKNNVYLTYEPSGFNKFHYNNQKGEYVWLSLGDVTDGKWHKIEINFQNALQKAYPNDKVVSFRLFLVRGDVMLDNIKLFNDSSSNTAFSDNSEVFINNCYFNILERKPDIEGKRYWIEGLKNGMSATDVVEYFFESDELKRKKLSDKEFVEKAYRTILGREPDRSGYEYWLNKLNEGVSKEIIIYEFAFSEEFAQFCDKCNVTNYSIEDQLEAFLERLYLLILNRKSDPQGKEEWKEALLQKRVTASQLVKGFFDSKEFKEKNISDEEFVKTAYRAILAREAEEEGLRYWTSLLASGKYTREEIVDKFLQSPEFKALVQKYQITL